MTYKIYVSGMCVCEAEGRKERTGEKMLRIALCDDERSAREALYIQLEQVIREDTEQIVYEFSSGISAVNWLKKHPGEIDLLFLDMEMEGLSGLETAKQIRAFDRNLMIVFVTGYAEYVFDGYSVGAMGYLMKPVKIEELQSVFTRIRKTMLQDADRMFILKNADGTYRFALQDILYFYSDRRKVTLVTESGEYSFYEKLDSIETQLVMPTDTASKISSEITFVRIHQRYLVNAQKVEHIGSTSVTIGENELPVSRAWKETAAKKLAKAMLGGV